jgi:Tol biopolymer transport system component
MPAAGGEPQQLTSDPTPDWRPSISRDGKQLVFYSYRCGNRHLWTMPATGGPARQLTTGDVGGDYHPMWSSDGSRVAFASTRPGFFSVWSVAADGSDLTSLTKNPGDNNPSWSPDGRWISFLRLKPDGQYLFRLPAAGGDATPFAKSRAFGHGSWSPDGRFLYFIRGQPPAGEPSPATVVLALETSTGIERPVADLAERPGRIITTSLANDQKYLYFTWATQVADLWIMDVVNTR